MVIHIFWDVWTSEYLPRIGLEYSNITLAPDSELYSQPLVSMETGQKSLGEWGRVERVETKGH